MLTDENERINTRLTSLQHLLHHERFDREERDIGEHQELTLLRTALVQLESCLPSILLNSSDVASISTQTPQVDIADAITAVENMARRRLVITDFPDVETYVEPEEEHAEVADGVEEKGIDDQVMLDVADARIREVGTSDAVQKSKATKKALPTPSPETFSTTSTAAFEDGTKPDYGTMVWARIASHPWYPAVVYDENMPGIPANVLASKPKQASSPSKDEKEKVWCVVSFFDEKRGWVPLQKLRMLGNEQALDDDMLAMKSRMQRKWPSRERAKVLAAYQAAMDNIAPEGDEEELQLSSLEEIFMG
ncbi:hypothetical protein CPB85DRAFT_186569 [Mucidula mucida]|nr:hypothetical protein CPB85DRAFT_186569 [Mucidula mucida]